MEVLTLQVFNGMKVLGIGYGRHLFDQNDFEYQRLKRCAAEVTSFDQIIFAKSDVGLQSVSEDNFTLHPTNSASKLTMIFDAVRIGSQLIVERNIEVITAQDVFETGVVGLLLKRKFPHVTLQVQEHGDVLSSTHWRKETFGNELRYRFALYLLRRVDVIRVVSERTRAYLESVLGPNKIIKKLPVVIDLSSFTAQLAESRNQDDDTFTFITAARFVPQKNFSLMLNAFAAVYESIPQVRLKIFGDGPDKSKICNLIHTLGLSEVVSVNEWTSSLSKEMTRADAYLLTSNYEGWARVLIEAMIAGLPTVTTDVGCANEVLKHMEHGLIVPVDNQSQLSAAMKQIAIDSELYDAISKRLSVIDTENIPGTNVETYAKEWVNTLR